MNTQQLDRTELISIIPPAVAQADLRISLDQLRARFARNEGLPFADVLTEARIRAALDDHGVQYRDRVFGPVTTLWGFLSQVLSEDHSCRDTVSRIIAHRVASGQAACSPNTASYCNARGRLPTGVLSTLTRQTAEELQAAAAPEWKWNGRDVFVADGSHVSMPDTPENQASYPQPVVQQPGIGFPMARLAVLLSLATGACHDLAIAPMRARGPARRLCCDRCMTRCRPATWSWPTPCSTTISSPANCASHGIELVAQVQAQRVGSRTVESRPDGDIILWQRPNKPRGMTGEQYRGYPKSLLMRQVSVDARDQENRAEQFDVITTILDASIDGGQIGDLYKRRWEGEVDLRSIKSVMQMDVLRCKTPEMVRKEIWAHLLAYNLRPPDL